MRWERDLSSLLHRQCQRSREMILNLDDILDNPAMEPSRVSQSRATYQYSVTFGFVVAVSAMAMTLL